MAFVVRSLYGEPFEAALASAVAGKRGKGTAFRSFQVVQRLTFSGRVYFFVQQGTGNLGKTLNHWRHKFLATSHNQLSGLTWIWLNL